MAKTSKSPFFHIEFPNFLNEKQYKRLCEIYEKLQFKQKSSDLFHFFQTNQLASEKSLDFFKSRLTDQFKPLCNAQQLKNSFYTTFASYYFQGDYLLCHDDIIQDRKYAFSYYLQDFNSGGQLVFFNNKANKQSKRIKPKKNTLVIFEVCDESYHQVAYCTSNGRKAVTGWFNVKGKGKTRIEKQVDKFVPHLLKQVIPFGLDSTYIDEEYFQLMDVQYQFNVVKQTLVGPFYSRRVHRIQVDPTVVFELPGCELISSDFYRFKQGDYLLLNDPMNTIQSSDDIIDVFVTNLPENFQVDEENMLVKIIQEDGSLSGIPEIHDSLFIVHRGKKQYYIERNGKEFILAHFIYRKSTKSNGKKEVKAKKQVKKQVTKTSQNKQIKKSNKKQAKKQAKNVKKIKKITKIKRKAELKSQGLSKKVAKRPKNKNKKTKKVVYNKNKVKNNKTNGKK